MTQDILWSLYVGAFISLDEWANFSPYRILDAARELILHAADADANFDD